MSASRLFVDDGRWHAWRAALTLLATALLAWPGMARAHDLGVARALLEELPGARYVLEVEVEPHLAPLFAPPELPERCGAPAAVTPDLGTLRFAFACAGEPLTAEDVLRLPWQRQGVMLTVRWADGSTARQFFAGTGAATEVPLAALNAGSGSVRNAALRYLGLGIEHILLGIDHLLFVLGLLLLVSGPWMLIKTITAFTVAHSITLALATLGLVAVPSRPVDAAIALSIVFLGAEILRARQGRPGLAARAPWVVAFAFGLLHGLGFAGALTQLGLPPGEIPQALLFFNVGVEIGQLLFVATFLALAWALRALQVAWPRWSEPLPAYAIGTVAAFWFIERTSAWVAMF
ncbi:MAG TPA: HupE/UreJ family protein [Geminicoccaceae bacterium]|jgi:hydrogenase/urease accessory protein HupE|nr:HupE/UreJ family protein [Geminicoccaceae bacterium]